MNSDYFKNLGSRVKKVLLSPLGGFTGVVMNTRR
jgi:hypothetical protein